MWEMRGIRKSRFYPHILCSSAFGLALRSTGSLRKATLLFPYLLAFGDDVPRLDVRTAVSMLGATGSYKKGPLPTHGKGP